MFGAKREPLTTTGIAEVPPAAVPADTLTVPMQDEGKAADTGGGTITYFTLQRIHQEDRTTVGILHLSGKQLAFILEDGESPSETGKKVHGQTRIPATDVEGYHLVPVYSGRFYTAYKKRWGHEFAVGVAAVPGFDLVRIHTGVDADDTLGCPLTGNGVRNLYGPGKPALVDSRAAYERLYREHFAPAMTGKNQARLIILDEDHFRLPWRPPVAAAA